MRRFLTFCFLLAAFESTGLLSMPVFAQANRVVYLPLGMNGSPTPILLPTVTPVGPFPTNTAVPVPPSPTQPTQPNCDPAYPGVCIPSPPDLSCEEVEFRDFVVLPADPHGFDRNQNGIGCESEPDPNSMARRLLLWVMTAPRILLAWLMQG